MLGILLTALYSIAVACHRCISTDILPATWPFPAAGSGSLGGSMRTSPGYRDWIHDLRTMFN